MPIADLRSSNMMTHILDALEDGKDIGHYGRLVFTIIAQYFDDKEAIVSHLQKDKDFSEEDARALFEQVTNKGYSPPNRDTILEYQSEQDFDICPNSDDPDACNIYQELTFPDTVYEIISEYNKEKAD